METKQKNTKAKKRLITLGTILSIVLFLFIGCFYTLSKGIRIQKINIANIELDGLYLKLNNKLIFTLDRLVIQESKKKKPVQIPVVIRWFQHSLVGISYFEQAEIKKIILPDHKEASIFYDGEQYSLDFPDLQALFEIQQNSQQIDLKIQKLLLDAEKVQINGNIYYLTSQNKIGFSLAIHANKEKVNKQEKLILEGDSDLKKLNVRAFSTPIEDLAFYEEEIKKIPTLHKWLMQKAKFKNLRIKNLFFAAPLNEDFIPKMLKSLYAELDLEDVQLKLEPELSPITTPKLKVKFQSEVLKFILNDPYYEGLSLQGSSVELHNLTRPKEGVKTLVWIKSQKAILNESIHRILRTYNVDFDVSQLDSSLEVDLKLSFQKIQDHLNVGAYGHFKASQTNLQVFGTSVFSENLNVVLDLNPETKHIFINDTKVDLQSPVIQGLVNLDIDLNNDKIEGSIIPSLIQITSSSNSHSPYGQFFILNKESIPKLNIEADFSSTPIIHIPAFDTTISLGETKIISLKDLSKIYAYSPLLQHLLIERGETTIQTTDFKNFNIQTEVTDLQYPIFDKNWNAISQLNATIRVKPNQISLTTSDEDIALQYDNHSLKILLKDKNFDFEAFKTSKIPMLSSIAFLNDHPTQIPDPIKAQNATANTHPQNQSSQLIESTQNTKQETPTPKKKQPSIVLYLESKNSLIRYNQLTVPTDEIIINTKKNKTTIDVTHKNGVVNLDLYDNIIKFSANNFSGNFINLVAGRELVQGGLFGAKGIYKNNILRAEVEIQNTIFKNFATLQNIVALIDTIPSLIVFKKPGFSTEGYQVSKGRVVLELNKEYLGLKKIDLVGDTIDINGGGIITLATQELNISLTISTIKGLSEVLSKIPIVGYLLLGKEGKISTSLILGGTLQKPKSEVTLAEDIISAPFKIIQRIFIPD